MKRALLLVFSLIFLTPIMWFLFTPDVESVPFYKLGWWLPGATLLLAWPCSLLIRRHKPEGQRKTVRNRILFWIFSGVMAFWFSYAAIIMVATTDTMLTPRHRTYSATVAENPFGFSGISSTVYITDRWGVRHCLVIQSHNKPLPGTAICFQARKGKFGILAKIKNIRTGPVCEGK